MDKYNFYISIVGNSDIKYESSIAEDRNFRFEVHVRKGRGGGHGSLKSSEFRKKYARIKREMAP